MGGRTFSYTAFRSETGPSRELRGVHDSIGRGGEVQKGMRSTMRAEGNCEQDPDS